MTHRPKGFEGHMAEVGSVRTGKDTPVLMSKTCLRMRKGTNGTSPRSITFAFKQVVLRKCKRTTETAQKTLRKLRSAFGYAGRPVFHPRSHVVKEGNQFLEAVL